MKGVLIAVEGLDLAGKTTNVIPRLIESLKHEGIDAVQFHSSRHGSPMSRQLRQLLLNGNMDDDADALLFAALRVELMKSSVLPALERGQVVIMDRFNVSTQVYQSNCAFINQLLPCMSMGRMADVTLFCSIERETYLERIRLMDRAEEMDKREKDLLASFDSKKKLFEQIMACGDNGVTYTINCNWKPEELRIRLMEPVNTIAKLHRS